MDIENKLRKGDYCALIVEHSSTPLKGPIDRYTRIVLARVDEASKAGLVRRVVLAGRDYSVEAARLGKVFALPTVQAEAAKLFENATYAGLEFETKEQFKAALEAA